MKRALIRNVTLLTMNEENKEIQGWILLNGKKIESMGNGPEPECDEIINGEGGYLLPGLIDIHSHVGLYEDAIGFEGADGNEDTDPVAPQMRALDGINPMDKGFAEALANGVTTVAVSPGSANPIGGQIALLKTSGKRIDDMIIKAPFAMKFAFGENPKSVYHDKDETPTTRMATAALVREQLFKAQEYFAQKQLSEENTDEESPDFDMKNEALVPLLAGKIPAHFHAHRADDIFTAIRIAREFNLKAVIIHGTEAHLVADILAEEQVPIVVGPYMTDRSKPELKNLTDEAPAILTKAGIPTAITVDHPEIPLRLLLTAAALAVKAGMSEFDALSAITRVPAKIAGMEQKIGMLQQGMDADCVLFSGHPLDIRSAVKTVWIGGQEVYGRTQ